MNYLLITGFERSETYIGTRRACQKFKEGFDQINKGIPSAVVREDEWEKMKYGPGLDVAITLIKERITLVRNTDTIGLPESFTHHVIDGLTSLIKRLEEQCNT